MQIWQLFIVLKQPVDISVTVFYFIPLQDLWCCLRLTMLPIVSMCFWIMWGLNLDLGVQKQVLYLRTSVHTFRPSHCSFFELCIKKVKFHGLWTRIKVFTSNMNRDKMVIKLKNFLTSTFKWRKPFLWDFKQKMRFSSFVNVMRRVKLSR